MQYEHSVKVKRGCSEFQDVFPDYNDLDENGNLTMECPEEWKAREGARCSGPGCGGQARDANCSNWEGDRIKPGLRR